ncbi:MAG: hypothetical protein IPP90_13580 [Gemmatimonadaceae bacterium]|nr:hypothetical protein [Gemmatimonadaceae bacterium]
MAPDDVPFSGGPIDLRTLGALNLSGSNAPQAAEALARPKPLALLLYLALARPQGFQPQDKLFALFWPESDAKRAQISLRQAVHVLKRALGDGIIARRGRSELGVDLSRLCCDALRFDEAIAAKQPELALERYQGDLLSGFYVPDAPDFERWLSGERARLRDLAIGAARGLMATSAAADDAAGAARWASRWCALSPDDQQALRCAMEHSVAAGDRSAALRTYDAFVEFLAEGDEQPDADLVQFASRVRERVLRDAPIRTPDTLMFEVESAPASMPLPVPPATGVQGLARRRRGLVWAVAAMTLLVAGVVGTRLYDTTRRTAAEGGVLATRIAVLPFTVRGGASVEFLREGLVDLLSAKLDGAGGLSTVDPRAIFAYQRAHTPISDDPRRAVEIAQQFAAGQYVMGSVIEAGGRIALNASIYDAAGRRRATADGSARDETQLLAAIDKLARDLLAAQFSDAPAHLEFTAATTTASLPALKAFLDGERAVRAGQGTEAVDAFSRAVREDSTFALAHYRLSTAADWSSQSALIQKSINLSMRFSDRLPQHERLSLRARSLVNDGAAEEADRQYRKLVATYPDDTDAWNQLGELLFHTGPWRGTPMVESRAAFEQVLARLPSDLNALLHLARLAALDRRSADVTALADRALALKPEREAVLELRGLRAAATSDSGDLRRQMDTLRATDGAREESDGARLTAWRVATYSDRPEVGALLIRDVSDSAGATHVELHQYVMLAHLDAARGQWHAAARDLDMAERTNASFAAEVRANLALMWPASLTHAARRRLIDILSPTEVPGPSRRDRLDSSDAMRRVRRAYLSGTLMLADGDSLAARAQQRQLVGLSREPRVDAELASHLGHELSARILWRLGNAAGALAEVEQGWPRGTPRASLPLIQGDTYTQAHERFFRGELLVALHRDAEALRWFASVTDDQGESLMLSAPVHMARARIAERGGDTATASAQYQRAIALWSTADSGGLSELRDARTHLRQLLSVSERGRTGSAAPVRRDPGN